MKRPRPEKKETNAPESPHDRMLREQRSVFAVPSAVYAMKYALQTTVPFILALLYPPARAVQDEPTNNRTSREVIRELNLPGDVHLNYVDLLSYTTYGSNSEVDQVKLHHIVEHNPQHAIDWGKRILRTAAETHNTVIYVGGKTANLAWEQFVDHQILASTRVYMSPVGGLSVQHYPAVGIVAVIGGIHPSAHLMSGGEPRITARFQDVMQLTGVLLRMNDPDDRTSGEKIAAALDATRSERQLVQAQRVAELGQIAGAGDYDWNSLPLYQERPCYNNITSGINNLGLAVILALLSTIDGHCFLTTAYDAVPVLQKLAQV